MGQVSIADITIDPAIQIRRRKREDAVQRYADAFDQLPPIVLMRTSEALLLCDGFHRLAAAERLGRTKVESKVKQGQYADALELAVVANSKNAESLTSDERDEGIRRIKGLHPNWSLRKIASLLSVSYLTVKRVLDVERVKASLNQPVTMVTPSHFREIASAPREHWERLAKEAATERWSVSDTADAVRSIRRSQDPEPQQSTRYSQIHLAHPHDGCAAGSSTQVTGIGVRKLPPSDAVLALRRALGILSTVLSSEPFQIVRAAGSETVNNWSKELPPTILFLQTLLARTNFDLKVAGQSEPPIVARHATTSNGVASSGGSQ